MDIDFYQVWHNHDLENNKNLISPLSKYLALEDFEVPKSASGMDIQEYRIWLMPDEFFNQGNNSKIGFASARWAEKFPDAPGIHWILSQNISTALPPRTWQTFITAGGHWMEHMSHFHRGITPFILEGAAQLNLPVGGLNNPCLPMCNSFVTTKELFFEAKARFNHLYNFYEEKYGNKFQFADNGYGERVLGCFYERVLMIVVASLPGTQFTNPFIHWQW